MTAQNGATKDSALSQTLTAPTWRCDRCEGPLDDAGTIYFDYAEWHAYQAANLIWHETHGEHLEGGGVIYDSADLADYPELRWHVVHDRCDGSAVTRGGLYWIDVDRMDTWAKVADWSAHLHGKEWFSDTDWGDLLYRAGVAGVAA